MSEGPDFWDQTGEYCLSVTSLWHIPAGELLREKIRALSPSGTCADLGCGPGYWLHELANSATLFAVDFSSNMLSQAAERAPAGTIFVQQALQDLDLGNELDFALCLNAVMPRNHAEALRILGAVFSRLKSGGRIVLVMPSLEALLYSANISHFDMAATGREQESLEQKMDTWTEWYSNPLGYVRNSNGNIVKYWLKDEAEQVFDMLGGVAVEECFRVPHRSNATGENPPERFLPSWYWGWVLRRNDPADLDGPR